MEFRPIVSALMRHKTGTVLVALQIAVSLAIIVNGLFIINQRIEKINRPTGMEVDSIIAVSVRGFGDDFNSTGSMQEDLHMLRNLPGVVAATAINQIPLSGSGSSTGVRSVPDEKLKSISTARYQFDQQGLETLGIELIAGRNFYPEEIDLVAPGINELKTPAGVLVTKALADRLYPEGDALGKPLYWPSMKSSTIIGIVGHMLGPWPEWEDLKQSVYLPRMESFDNNSRYLIRTEAGERDRLLATIEEKLAELNRHRLIRRISTHTDIVARTYEMDRAVANILLAVIVLLVGLTALVIVGLASYFVSERTKQIGTRRALGATRADILRYFLVENWIITTVGALTGCLLTVAVSYWLETSFELPRLDYRYLLACVVALWLISQLSALFPASRAAAVSPAVATRTV